MADLSPNISVIKLDKNCLNIPLKRQRLAEWILKNDPMMC